MAVSSGTPLISYLDDKLIREVMRSLNDLAAVGVNRLMCCLPTSSALPADGATCAQRRPKLVDHLGDPLDRDQYHFDEVIFETIPADQAQCASIIRPILDLMSNAGGKATSPIFDNQGHYIPLQRS